MQTDTRNICHVCNLERVGIMQEEKVNEATLPEVAARGREGGSRVELKYGAKECNLPQEPRGTTRRRANKG